MNAWQEANAFLHDRSDWDRGFISNPFAGDDSARLGLERTGTLLQELGDPQTAYPIVHVAGSKGKGSTCAFADAILRAADIRSGRTLSPHVHSWRERFVVNNELISEDDFGKLIGDVREAVDSLEARRPELGRITAFELGTAAALLWFARSGCDVGVVEVGLGGTLDATNVVTPAVSVITKLDYEHTAILGDTLAEIASNKAGIVKPHVPVVSAYQATEAMEVIEQRSAALNAPLSVVGRDIGIEGDPATFSVTCGGRTFPDLHNSMRGSHQIENAALAIAAVMSLDDSEVLPRAVAASDVQRGLTLAFLPGRFQVIRLESGHMLVVDGAHTPDSMRACVATIEQEFPGREVTAIVGMLRDKSPEAVLAPLARMASQIIVTPLASPRALRAPSLIDALSPWTPKVAASPSLADALDRALSVTPRDAGVIVFAGSMTLIHEALTLPAMAETRQA
jgi:dihydrofolate synthase/folylpolyglutamate synthase